MPDKLKPTVRKNKNGAEVETKFKIEQAGRYRLRASTVDLAGRSTVVWKNLVLTKDAANGLLRFTAAP